MDENDLANPSAPLGEDFTAALRARLFRQRAQYIAEQYGLFGSQDPTAAQAHLSRLLNRYTGVEIALVEILVETWSLLPPPRGTAFLAKVEARLQHWHTQAVGPTLTPTQFQHITGLHPLGFVPACPSPVTNPQNYP